MSKIVQSPGEFLSNMLEKHKISTLKFSKDIFLSQSAARLITIGKTRISVPVALRLAAYFGTNPEYWLNMQMRWDLFEATQDKGLMDIVKKISKFQKDPDAGKKSAAKKADAGKAGAKKPAAAKAAAKPAAAKKGAVKSAAPAGAKKKPVAAKEKNAEAKKPAAKRVRTADKSAAK